MPLFSAAVLFFGVGIALLINPLAIFGFGVQGPIAGKPLSRLS